MNNPLAAAHTRNSKSRNQQRWFIHERYIEEEDKENCHRLISLYIPAGKDLIYLTHLISSTTYSTLVSPPPLYADEPVDAKILIVHLYLQISSSFLLRATITKLYVVYYKMEALLLYF